MPSFFDPLAYHGCARAYCARCCRRAYYLRAHFHCLRFPLSGELILFALLTLTAALVALALLFDARVSAFFDLVNVHEVKIWLR